MFRPGLWRLCASLALSFVLLQSTLAAPPQTAAASPQALVLLQKSLATMVGNASISDVTLSGSARHIAGSLDESGTITLRALATGESRLDLDLPSGARSETSTNSPSGPVGAWRGADQVAHAIPQHNLWSDSSWFFPEFTLGRWLGPGYSITYIGHETWNGQEVEHLSAVRQFQVSGAPAGWSPETLQQLTINHIYLDSSTLLPVGIAFDLHPDHNQTIAIPVEIRLSDYRNQGGVLVPFHIQKLFNNGLDLDIQISAVNLDAGLSATLFSVQ
jgi:hypothetical protein